VFELSRQLDLARAFMESMQALVGACPADLARFAGTALILGAATRATCPNC